ncbi:MAG: MFS transporter [Actinomycetota bacterium]
MPGLRRERWRAPLAAFAEVFRNPNLRRLMIAWNGLFIGQWAYWIAIGIYAYQAGGALAVGVVQLIQTFPAAIGAPFTALLSDRYPRHRVYLAANLAQAVALFATGAAVLAGAPTGVVYALAAVNAVVQTMFWPAQTALLPSLARSPEELTASNVASSTIESIGTMVGSILGGVLVAATSVGTVFVVAGAVFLVAASFAARIHVERSTSEKEHADRSTHAVHELLQGFRAIRHEPGVPLLVLLISSEWLLRGALAVLIVVTALGLLHIGQPGVGFLNAAFGVGALVGALGSLALVGRRRLATPLGLGVVVWGIPIALIPIWPSQWTALSLLAVVGVANSLSDVAGYTLLQRIVPEQVLGRVLGVVEGTCWFTFGVGAIGAPLLISLFGVRWTLVAAGLALPLLIAFVWRRLVRIDDRATVPMERIELLRGIPMFAPLGPPTLERLASQLVELREPAETTIIREGEPGDRFYVLAEGVVDVYAEELRLSTLERGDYFGEIALLHDVPRTATVTARTDVLLFALERDEFLAAVTGHAQSRESAEAVISARLVRLGGLSR